MSLLVQFDALNLLHNQLSFQRLNPGYVCELRLVMKEEASDYLELETIKNLVRKYSQFINFPIYVWASKVMTWRGLDVKLTLIHPCRR